MVPEDTIKRQIKHVLKGTDFDLGRKYDLNNASDNFFLRLSGAFTILINGMIFSGNFGKSAEVGISFQ